MTAIAHFLKEAEEALETERTEENCLGVETLETVGAGWEAGVYLEAKRGYPGEFVPMRHSPHRYFPFKARSVLAVSAYLAMTEKAFSRQCAVHGTHPSAAQGIYSVLSLTAEETETEAHGDTADGRRAFNHETVNRVAREAEAMERLISRTLDRAETLGTTLTPTTVSSFVAKLNRKGM